MQEVFSIAVVRPHQGKEQETVDLLQNLYVLLRRKNYSRDLLYRDAQDHNLLVNLRYWTSEHARQEAHEDPDVHRFWLQLGQLCEVERVYERLEEMPQQH